LLLWPWMDSFLNKIVEFLLKLLSGLLKPLPKASEPEAILAPSGTPPIPPTTIVVSSVTAPVPSMNQAGIDLIKSFEGLELKAYPDPGTGGDPWTIGYGHTGPEVKPGLVWTQEEADAALVKDLDKFVSGVTALLTSSVTPNQFSALVSFAYNCGLANLKSSTLLKKVNAGDIAGAANEFPRWNKAAGKVLAGLTRRREAEKALFLLA